MLHLTSNLFVAVLLSLAPGEPASTAPQFLAMADSPASIASESEVRPAAVLQDEQDSQGEKKPQDEPPAVAAGPKPKEVELTYLGNEAFLLEGWNQGALIDAFVDHTPEDPSTLPDSVVEEFGKLEGMFQNVVVSVTSHHHEGGLLAESMLTFQRNHARALLWTVPEALTKLTAAWDYEDKKFPSAKIKRQMPEPEDWHKFGWGGLNTVFMNMPHAGPGAVNGEHVAHILRVGGVRVFVAGHALAADKELSIYSQFVANIHVAMVPYGYLLDAKTRELLQDHVSPQYIVPTGIPADKFADVKKVLEGRFDNLLIFEKPLEKQTVTIERKN